MRFIIIGKCISAPTRPDSAPPFCSYKNAPTATTPHKPANKLMKEIHLPLKGGDDRQSTLNTLVMKAIPHRKVAPIPAPR